MCYFSEAGYVRSELDLTITFGLTMLIFQLMPLLGTGTLSPTRQKTHGSDRVMPNYALQFSVDCTQCKLILDSPHLCMCAYITIIIIHVASQLNQHRKMHRLGITHLQDLYLIWDIMPLSVWFGGRRAHINRTTGQQHRPIILNTIINNISIDPLLTSTRFQYYY